MPAQLWTIILAAGGGRRLSSVTGGIPKQFWRPWGERSLLEETVARVAPLTTPEQTVTVVACTQRPYVDRTTCRDALGQIVYQPQDRGTAAGVMLGLSTVLTHDPDAMVLLTPSDHGIARPRLFAERVEETVAAIEAGAASTVLFGFHPSSLSSDFGWIVPDAAHAADLRSLKRIRNFVEKPDSDSAKTLFLQGGVWNTMVIVAKARTLLNLFRTHLPELDDVFGASRPMSPGQQDEFLTAVYPTLPVWDFSRDLIARAKELFVHVLPASIGWTDLGTPERLMAWMGADSAARSACARQSENLIPSVA